MLMRTSAMTRRRRQKRGMRWRGPPLRSSPTGEKLEAICQINLDGVLETLGEAEGADLPMGFGRD
jgi:hypothetical protein